MSKLLVLDRLDYKKRHDELMRLINESTLQDNDIVYTTYEDSLIRWIRNFKLLGSPLQHLLYWFKSLKYSIKLLKTNADTIYCLNPIVAIFLGLFNRNKRIIMGGFLFEPKANKLYYNIRKCITKLSLQGIDKIAVYSSREVKYYNNIFGNNKFVFVPYGIDYENSDRYSNKLPNEYFFSGGGSNRDYKTLVEAYNNLEEDVLPLVIATQPWRLNEYDTSKINVLSDVTVETFGDVMGKSVLLILSLRDGEISAGHMVMFQAMSQGTPILVNDIPAIRDYVDDTMVTFYKSGDIEDLTAKIRNFKQTRKTYMEKSLIAKRKYDKELTLKHFIQRFMAL